MEYELIRSDRRTLAVEIGEGGRVIVRAPRMLPVRKIERFLTSREDWITAHAEMQRRREEKHGEPDDEERLRLIAAAKAEIPPKVERYAEIMGLSYTGIRITGARTRFGSCSPKNSLCFSWRLMQYPEEAVDYVVVHELAHIVHKNHGPRFYALVESVMPDWKRRRAMLKE